MLAVILGPAHSGTSILAYVLRQHPDIYLACDGNEAWLLENDLLPNKDVGGIKALLDQHENVLLKRPWTEFEADWLLDAFPDVRLIYCQRAEPDLFASWMKPDSLVDCSMRHSATKRRQVYQQSRAMAGVLEQKTFNVRRHDHDAFLAQPSTVKETAAWLGLRPFDFDTSIVGTTNIKERLKMEGNIKTKQELETMLKRSMNDREVEIWNGTNIRPELRDKLRVIWMRQAGLSKEGKPLATHFRKPCNCKNRNKTSLPSLPR
jgi:hypothetical protein